MNGIFDDSDRAATFADTSEMKYTHQCQLSVAAYNMTLNKVNSINLT